MPEQQQVATVQMCEQHGHLRSLTFALWQSPASLARGARAAATLRAANDGGFALVLMEGVHGGPGRTLDG